MARRYFIVCLARPDSGCPIIPFPTMELKINYTKVPFARPVVVWENQTRIMGKSVTCFINSFIIKCEMSLSNRKYPKKVNAFSHGYLALLFSSLFPGCIKQMFVVKEQKVHWNSLSISSEKRAEELKTKANSLELSHLKSK